MAIIYHFKKFHPGESLPDELRPKHKCPAPDCSFASKKEINLKIHVRKSHRDLTFKEDSPWYQDKVNVVLCERCSLHFLLTWSFLSLFISFAVSSCLSHVFLSATEFSVADYDSTPHGVGVVGVVVVVVVVRVQIKNGITF